MDGADDHGGRHDQRDLFLLRLARRTRQARKPGLYCLGLRGLGCPLAFVDIQMDFP